MSLTPWEWLTELLACAVDTLDEAALPLKGAPGRQYISAEGTIVHDNCCEDGGQVWTRLTTAAPVNPLPVLDQRITPCTASMGIEIGVGIVRCGHTLDDEGDPPSASDLTADAYQITSDMVSLRRAILCCPSENRKILGLWTPTVGLGGCIGGEWTVWVPANFTVFTSPAEPDSPASPSSPSSP